MAVFFGEGTELTFERATYELNLRREGPDQVVVIDDMIFLVHEVDEIRIKAFTGTKWPNGEVFYGYDTSVTSDPQAETMKAQFENACKEWSAIAKVSFKLRTNQQGYILVEKSTSVQEATVGYTGKKQVFRIENWNNHIIIAHELGHTLGLSHEHVRSDRNKYVRIHEDNIKEGKNHNFKIEPSSVNYSNYDFGSIMHYGRFAFAKDTTKPTISAMPGHESNEALMGNRTKLSASDKADMASHYGT